MAGRARGRPVTGERGHTAAAASLFEALATGSADGTIVRATAHCSYLQIYGDRVQDLLVPDPSKAPALQVREAPSNLGSKGRSPVRGLSEYQVASAAELLALVARGTKGRATRATRSNEHSSRSHAVLQLALEVESVEKGNDENNDPARWSQLLLRRAAVHGPNAGHGGHAHGGSPREALARGPGWV